MKTVIAFLLLITTTPVLMSTSCNKGRCRPDTICTEIFSMVMLRITDQSGQPVVLDEAYTVRTKTSETIRIEQNMEGTYIVLDDNYRKKLENESDNFRFIGKLNGQEVVNEPFTISADCCHINKVNGREEVKL